MGLAAPGHVASSWSRDWTCVPCIGRRTLNYSLDHQGSSRWIYFCTNRKTLPSLTRGAEARSISSDSVPKFYPEKEGNQVMLTILSLIYFSKMKRFRFWKEFFTGKKKKRQNHNFWPPSYKPHNKFQLFINSYIHSFIHTFISLAGAVFLKSSQCLDLTKEYDTIFDYGKLITLNKFCSFMILP